VPPVRPLPVATADVEAVRVAPTQPEGDASSARGRVGTSVPQEAWSESWTPRSHVVPVEL
jgi:hypothetical protein